MDSNQKSQFDNAMARYQSGGDPAELIKDFEAITASNPNHSSAWTCLAWLQLLCNQNEAALRSARLAVKLNGQEPQARINLSLALIETESKGVRDQIDFVKRALIMVPDLRTELRNSIEDGLTRKPEWQALKKIKKWLEM